jgi:hypothetical protein
MIVMSPTNTTSPALPGRSATEMKLFSSSAARTVALPRSTQHGSIIRSSFTFCVIWCSLDTAFVSTIVKLSPAPPVIVHDTPSAERSGLTLSVVLLHPSRSATTTTRVPRSSAAWRIPTEFSSNGVTPLQPGATSVITRYDSMLSGQWSYESVFQPNVTFQTSPIASKDPVPAMSVVNPPLP